VLVEELDSDEEDVPLGKAKSRPWESVGMEGATPEPAKEVDEETKARWKREEADEADRVASQFAKAEEHRGKGNECLKNGDLDGACEEYNNARNELRLVGNQPEDRKRYEKEVSILHSNEALAHLKYGTASEAKDHANQAVMHDCTNVKALFRRGLAQAKLAREAPLYQDREAAAACLDFEEVLKLDPTNTDAVKELQKVQREREAQEKDYLRAQKKTWTRVFGGRTEGDWPEKEEAPLSTVRQCSDTSRHLTASASGVRLPKVKGQAVLESLTLELRRGWCVGLDAEDRHTRAGICRLFAKAASPSAGTVEFHRNEHRSGIRFETPKITIPTLVAVGVAGFFLIVVLAKSPLPWWLSLALSLYLMCAYALFAGACWDYLDNCSWANVMDPEYMSEIPESSSVEEAVSATMPKVVKQNERRGRVAAMLRAVTDGSDEQRIRLDSKFSELQDQHKQVVYLLRCMAKRSPVLICNEPLKGLDSEWHPRIFRMLKRMKKDLNTSLVYLSTDMQQLRVMADSLGLISSGEVHELGPASEVLVAPRSDAMKAHLEKDTTAESAEAMNRKLQALLTDKSLNGLWLPSLRGD